jgi:hypothetical protein
MTETEPSRDAQIKALIDAEVERALAPYRAMRMPPDALEELETMLRIALGTHPDAQLYLRQLVDDPLVNRSDSLKVRDVLEGGGEGAKETEK